MISELLIISVGAILINNFVLVQFLGICPFLGVSKKVETASGMGFAVVFVMICASALTWLVQEYLLIPFGIEYMQTIAFILVIAVLVQFVEMFLQKSVPSLYNSLGVYLPLITTNCAVLGVAINNITKFGGTEMSFVKSIVYGGRSGIHPCHRAFCRCARKTRNIGCSRVFKGYADCACYSGFAIDCVSRVLGTQL